MKAHITDVFVLEAMFEIFSHTVPLHEMSFAFGPHQSHRRQ